MNIAVKQGQWIEKKKELNAQNTRCQKCLEVGHWTFQCKGKRKNIYRLTRMSLLKKRLKARETGCQNHIIKTEKEITKLNLKIKEKKKEDSSDDKTEDSDSDSSSLSSSSSSSLNIASDSSDSSDLDSTTSSNSSTSSSLSAKESADNEKIAEK